MGAKLSHIPINADELSQRGWNQLDIIFVTGDAYIDHPSFGVPLLARWLEYHGFKVGIIPQPDWRSKEAFMSLGQPRLFFGVSAGAMDSMLAHYTPQRKLRHDDAYTPGNRHGARPNRATIVYTSRLREAYRDVPIVIGGIEASLRRNAHYDFWEDKVRRSILLDSKADLLVFGMAEMPILEIAERLRNAEKISALKDVKGTAFLANECPFDAVEVPSFEEVASEKRKFVEAFKLLEQEQNPYSGRSTGQRHGTRWLVCNPPARPLSQSDMDRIYSLPYTRQPHPSYTEKIPAFEQIRLSITTHRGCFGGCSFCAIASHQGKFIQSRSIASIEEEVHSLVSNPWFRGHISDLGGPTANMYGLSCTAKDNGAGCRRQSCLFPAVCPKLDFSDSLALKMLARIRAIKGIRTSVISSGIRYDLLKRQQGYFRELIEYHVGGLLKVAPEHLSQDVTRLMRKPSGELFREFLRQFRTASREAGRNQAVVPYLMSGHPGCTFDAMVGLAEELSELNLNVEQVQEFTPTPGTASTCMYYSGIDPQSGMELYVARGDRERRVQKSILLCQIPEEKERVIKELKDAGRGDLAERIRKLSLRHGISPGKKNRPRHK